MRRIKAFTLVELLVVIGIIAVLISILLPALSRAWAQARIIKCQSNIRQVHQAMMLYVGDNQGRLPIPGMYGHVFPYYGIITAQVGTYDYSDSGGRLMPYLGSSPATRQSIMLCPADGEPRIAGASSTWQPDPTHLRNFSYNLNYDLMGVGVQKPTQEADVYAGLKITQIHHSAHKFLIYEQNAPRDATAQGAIGNPAGVVGPDPVLFLLSTRHLGRCNMGFADGHVEQFEPRSLIQQNPYVNRTAAYEYLTYD